MRMKKVLGILGACLALSLMVAGQVRRLNPNEIVLQLLDSLWVYDEDGRPASRKLGFELPEGVVNTYLSVSLKLKPRPMISAMHVQLLPGNRCLVEAKVDLDQVRRYNSAIFSGPEEKIYRGTKSLRAEFHFAVDAGFLTFEAAPLPAEVHPSKDQLMAIVQQIALHQPEKIDSTHKIPVPFGMQKLWTEEQKLCGDTYR